jgi:hypothetical protein
VTKLLRVALYSLAALLFAGTSAQASPIIDFVGFNGGTIEYAGGINPLIGTNILIDKVVGINTPSGTDPGGYAVTSGFLNFETGDLASTETDASGTTYNFNGSGTFTITGGVAAAGISDTTNGLPTVLLSGSFVGAQVSPFGVINLFISTGSDDKHPDLVSFFGLPSTSLFAFSATSHLNDMTVDGETGGFTATAHSTDVSNTVVPEPGSMMLFGSGLVGLSALVKRRKQQKQQAL